MSKNNNEYEVGQVNTAPPQRRGGPMGGGRMMGEKPKNFTASWGKLLRYARSFLPAMIFAVICSMAGAILTLIGPQKIRDITNLIEEGLKAALAGSGAGIDLVGVTRIAVTLIVMYSVGALLTFGQGFTMTTIAQRLSKKLRTNISQKINRLPLKYFDGTTFGNILSRVTNDIDTLGMTFNQSVGQLVTSFTSFFGAIIMMFLTNVPMTFTAIITTFLGFGAMMLIISKTQKYFRANQKHLGMINGHIEEIYAGHNIIKAYNGEREAKETFDKYNDKLYESNWRSQFLSGLMMPLMNFIGNFGYVAVCVVGAGLALNNKIDLGVIVAFMMYIRMFTQPLSQMAQSFTSMQSTAAAAERVFEFIEEEELSPERADSKVLDPKAARGEVKFKNVKFGYSPEKPVIHNFSADIKPGQKVAIVGPTGAGKTTLVNLLMRFYETDNGEIEIDGIPISDMSRENVHNLFCMVLQDTWLFEGTIKQNILYSMKDVDDERIIEACKAVGMDHFIRTLPYGYKTTLNDNANLSAGQKQLLTIARAMIQNSPLLILDEATSSVDTRTELLVQQAMDKLTQGRTSFVIAHRLSTIRNADLILVLNDGDIVESGNHEKLLAQNGFYAALYNSQFEEAS